MTTTCNQIDKHKTKTTHYHNHNEPHSTFESNALNSKTDDL